MDSLRFAAMGYPITRYSQSQREKVKSIRELRRELESRREHQRRKDANFAMERTPNVSVRRWTTIMPMLKFPRYIYTRGNMMEPPSPFARQSVVRKNVDRQSVVESHFAKSSHASRNDNATFSELTKSANEEPGGVLRNRNRSICVQPDDLRNPRQLS